MAVVNVKTGLTQSFTPQIGTGLVWIVNDGTGPNHLSNVAGALGDWRTHYGEALQPDGDRSAARLYQKAINNNAA